jgi:hypothetical protein
VLNEYNLLGSHVVEFGRSSPTFRWKSLLHLEGRTVSKQAASFLPVVTAKTIPISADSAVMILGKNFYVDKWPRCLRHELSSPARTLGSWVRVPLETWMCVRVSSNFVYVAAKQRADPPSKESY